MGSSFFQLQMAGSLVFVEVRSFFLSFSIHLLPSMDLQLQAA